MTADEPEAALSIDRREPAVNIAEPAIADDYCKAASNAVPRCQSAGKVTARGYCTYCATPPRSPSPSPSWSRQASRLCPSHPLGCLTRV
jgi:hypothetical protein